LCNAGIYAISSKVIERVPKSRRYEMTDLISSCTSKQMKVHIFPIYENWTDIGNIDDLERARRKFIDSQEFNLTHREESQ
jgi:NDP-sugar pyrophosphorylase family protein